jgi:hypothetical protein
VTAVRTVARLVSVLLIALGTGLVTYGAAVDPAQFHSPGGLFPGPAETIAWGVSLLIGGMLVLVMFGVRAPVADKPGRP